MGCDPALEIQTSCPGSSSPLATVEPTCACALPSGAVPLITNVPCTFECAPGYVAVSESVFEPSMRAGSGVVLPPVTRTLSTNISVAQVHVVSSSIVLIVSQTNDLWLVASGDPILLPVRSMTIFGNLQVCLHSCLQSPSRPNARDRATCWTCGS